MNTQSCFCFTGGNMQVPDPVPCTPAFSLKRRQKILVAVPVVGFPTSQLAWPSVRYFLVLFVVGVRVCKQLILHRSESSNSTRRWNYITSGYTHISTAISPTQHALCVHAIKSSATRCFLPPAKSPDPHCLFSYFFCFFRNCWDSKVVQFIHGNKEVTIASFYCFPPPSSGF